MADSPFNAYSHYYDLLYRDKDYKREVEYIDRLLRLYKVTGNELLEFGSGTGKHGRLLAQHGYKVLGIERSVDMVAKSKALDGFRCQVGDITAVQLGRTFDAVLSLFHVMSYQITNEALQAVFSRAGEHLLPGGLFIFDVWYSPAVYAQRPSVRIKQLEDEVIRVTRIAQPEIYPNEDRVDVNYQVFVEDKSSGEVKILSELHPMRHFSLPELDLFAEFSGFQFVGAEEFLTGNIPSEETWGINCIFKKV